MKAARNCLGPPRHVVGIAQPDRPRRGRPGGPEPEQTVERHAGLLRAQVVQRGIDGPACSLLALGQARVDLVEGPGIVAQQSAGLFQPGGRRGGGLPVAVDRRRLPVADEAVVPDLHLHEIDRVRRLAGNDEGLRELERHRPRRQLHVRIV